MESLLSKVSTSVLFESRRKPAQREGTKWIRAASGHTYKFTCKGVCFYMRNVSGRLSIACVP